MAAKIYINNGWKFSKTFDESMTKNDADEADFAEVRIPHTVSETPFNYFDEGIYQMTSCYRKSFEAPLEWKNKSVRLVFEGIAHFSSVYLNGTEIVEHECGYTAFSTDISDYLKYGEENLIAVKVDSNETLNQPPFGFVIDYMTYGGIYRDVYFEVSEKTYLEDVFITSEIEGKNAVLRNQVTIGNVNDSPLILTQYINDNQIGDSISFSKQENITLTFPVQNIDLWDIDNPVLYEIKTVLSDETTREVLDEKTVKFGFRTSEFKKEGYYLNGKKLRIRGLNRHQSYPYVGYAMPASMQRLDADILKYELGLNAVRTSHYPQSQAFIDRCDEIGLLVFTEIPGWQHIGDENWKKKAIRNVEDMILQYRNHPSIILWGVRINESGDDDEFYRETNRVAHKLDPSRPTGGVRALKKSNLLEDVYTYNDFVHEGTNKGCEPKKKVTSDMNKPYLISEYNGHMYSTKSFDWEEHRRNHAIRHATVINDVAGEPEIAGSFGWCMFDYNTHKDFGSGDRICYHGVMDMFRNPKMAAYVYSCQQETEPVLEISSSMDIGEHPGCNRGETYIFTNAESVKMYKNNRFLKEYKPADSPFKNLKHGPIIIDDFIGDAVEEGESNRPGWARKDLKEAFNATARYGLSHLPGKIYLKAAKLVAFNHMSVGDAVSMYNRYVGDWGGQATVYRFEAIKNGQVVKTLTKATTKGVHLEAIPDHTDLEEGITYDVALVRIRVLDDFNNQVSFFNEPLSFETEGPIEIIGPSVIGAKGGMAGVYVKTTGETGPAVLRIMNSQCETVTIKFNDGKEN